ncbi:MAG: methyltransferase family protein [Caulobacteraceae bacterium]
MAAIDDLRGGEAQALSKRAWLIVDYGERVLLVCLYLLLVQRLAPSLGRQPINSLLLIGESLVVGFVIFRRSTEDVSRRPLDWMLALAGTLPPLFLRSGGDHLASGVLAATLMVAGIMTQVSAKAFLRRSFGMAPANRGVKRDGPYRLVRHPIYVGYAITWAGFLLVNAQPFNLALVVFACAMQVARVVAEERLLGKDPIYRAYACEVRFRLIPGLF